MTRTIGGNLDLETMRVLYRPHDPAKLGAEVRRLAATGLKPRDISAALHMGLPDVLDALRVDRYSRQDS